MSVCLVLTSTTDRFCICEHTFSHLGKFYADFYNAE